MRILKTITVMTLIALMHCHAYNLVEKLENPGGGPQIPRKIFVHPTSVTGSMGSFITVAGCAGSAGIAAADCACRAQATAAGLANSNKFIAWLSDNTNDAICRVQGMTGSGCAINSNSAWYNTKGDLVAGGLADLKSGLKAAVLYTDAGMTTVATQIFTGTTAAGIKSASNCLNWTSVTGTDVATSGSPTVSGPGWTEGGTVGCTSAYIYCIESQ